METQRPKGKHPLSTVTENAMKHLKHCQAKHRHTSKQPVYIMHIQEGGRIIENIQGKKERQLISNTKRIKLINPLAT